MPRPIGQCFTVNVDGEDTTYHIQPGVFSDDTRDALCRLKRKQHAENEFANIPLVEEQFKKGVLSKELHDGMINDIRKRAFDDSAFDYEVSMNTVQEMLATREGKIAVLVRNCDEIKTAAQAAKVIDAYGNDMELFILLMKAGEEAITSAKNLVPLEDEGEEKETPPNGAPKKKPRRQSSQTRGLAIPKPES
jgi:hypothetical protein